jgi:hypothetical protein
MSDSASMLDLGDPGSTRDEESPPQPSGPEATTEESVQPPR